jgi:Coenzyme PQQ synthesis protein D (PqqD)
MPVARWSSIEQSKQLRCSVDVAQSRAVRIASHFNSTQRMIAMVSQAPNLKAIVNEDGAAILDIEHDLIATLNPMGAYVWQGLQRGETIDTIIANLSRDTGEDSLLVEADVREFVAELQQKRLMPR